MQQCSGPLRKQERMSLALKSKPCHCAQQRKAGCEGSCARTRLLEDAHSSCLACSRSQQSTASKRLPPKRSPDLCLKQCNCEDPTLPARVLTHSLRSQPHIHTLCPLSPPSARLAPAAQTALSRLDVGLGGFRLPLRHLLDLLLDPAPNTVPACALVNAAAAAGGAVAPQRTARRPHKRTSAPPLANGSSSGPLTLELPQTPPARTGWSSGFAAAWPRSAARQTSSGRPPPPRPLQRWVRGVRERISAPRQGGA